MILEKGLYKKKNRILNGLKAFKASFKYLWNINIPLQRKEETEKKSIGAPALTLKGDGELRCTSCLLCQTICPSRCIYIEADPSSPEESAPLRFDINILKCTFCSLCEEVCPVDAIRMAGDISFDSYSEQEWLWDKNFLSTYAGELKSQVGEDRPLLP